jgi:hypothetical protein
VWQHRFETETDIDASRIWPILADVSKWAEVDHNIEKIQISSLPAAGVPFTLKPKGGPTLSFVIGDFEPPCVYSDICKLPLASMKTLHKLEGGAKTRIVVDITITGPLSWVWGQLVGKKHASGLPAQTERILSAARAQF